METRIKVTALSYADVLNLCKKVMESQTAFSLECSMEKYKRCCFPQQSDTFEDALAKCLFFAKGGIVAWDVNSNNNNQYYGHLQHKWDGMVMCYRLRLNNVREGIENALNGNFGNSRGLKDAARAAVYHLAENGAKDFTYMDAHILMQIIIFGEVVYL